MDIVSQSDTDVKQEVAEAWDVQDTEQKACLEIDGPDPILDLSWWGYPLQEVLA